MFLGWQSIRKRRLYFAKVLGVRARASSVVSATFLIVAAIVLMVMATTASAAPEPNAWVKAAGFNLQLDGKPFAIKGMNYSPVPIGASPGNVPFGDYFIPYYANVRKPDVDKMREAGVNAIARKSCAQSDGGIISSSARTRAKRGDHADGLIPKKLYVGRRPGSIPHYRRIEQVNRFDNQPIIQGTDLF